MVFCGEELTFPVADAERALAAPARRHPPASGAEPADAFCVIFLTLERIIG